MKTDLIFFLFINLIIICDCKTTYTIGALFHNNEHHVQDAFSHAIQRYNMYDSDVEFKIDIRNIPTADTYKTKAIICDMIESDARLVAIFTSESLTTAGLTESICRQLDIPLLQIFWKAHHQPNTTVINFFPNNVDYVKGLTTIFRHLDWKDYVILYEKEEALTRLQEILKVPSAEYKRNVLIRQLGPNGNYAPVLKEIKNSTITKILIDCETDNILKVLDQAMDINLVGILYGYFFPNLDGHTLDFKSLKNGLNATNVTTVRIVDPDSRDLELSMRDWAAELSVYYTGRIKMFANQTRTTTALVLDAVKQFAMAISITHGTKEIYPKKKDCDSPDYWEDGQRLSQDIKEVQQRVNNSATGSIRFDVDGQRINFELQLIQVINDEAQLAATWRPSEPDTITFAKDSSERNQQIIDNLSKTTVIVTSRFQDPYLMPANDSDNLEGNARFRGFTLDIIDAISKILNFKYEFRIVEDGRYGNWDDEKKSWNGLIKEILDNKAHLGICDLTITRDRQKVVDFSSPFMTLGISILHKKSPKIEQKLFAFLEPLDDQVWLFTATVFLGVGLAGYFVARMSPDDWEKPRPWEENPEELENIWTLGNSMWLTLGSIMTQGCDILPKGISFRLMTSLWWFFAMILMTSSYTANLAAFLSKRSQSTITSAESLAQQNKIQYGVVDGGATQSFFKNSSFPTYNRMWEQMLSFKPSVFEKTNDDGIKRVRNTKQQLYAFLMESSTIEYIVERNCKLKQVGDWLDSKGYGIAMPLNAPYRKSVNNAVLTLEKNGELRRLKEKWWKVKAEDACEVESESSSSTSLTLENVGGVFVVLGIGIGLGFAVAIVEFLWNVKNLAIQEHISYWDTLVAEMMFAIRVWDNRKPVKPQVSEGSSPSTSEDNFDGHSIADRVKTGITPFLDIFDKISMRSKQ